MSELDVHGALVQAVIDAGFGWPCKFEEDPSFNPQPGDDWVRVMLMPGATDVASNGVGGADEHQGFLQLDFNTAPNAGVGALIAKADAARVFFPAGKRFFKNSQCVLVTRCERTQIRAVDGWARVTVSIFYSAYMTRSEV